MHWQTFKETFLCHILSGLHSIILILYLLNLLDFYNFFPQGLSMVKFI